MTDSLPSTLAEAAAALRSRRLTSVSLTTELLTRTDALDSTLGTFVARFDDTLLIHCQFGSANCPHLSGFINHEFGTDRPPGRLAAFWVPPYGFRGGTC